MLNTPGIPSVIRKRAQTPPHLKSVAHKPSGGAGAGNRKGEAKGKEEQSSMETIYHAGDILEAAKMLDLNILRDTALLWIAEEFWLSPLPDHWEEAITDEDHVYYVNGKTGVTQWEHPLEQYYKGLIYMKKGCQGKVDKAKMANPPTETEVKEMAAYFEVDLDSEPHCRHLLEEAVCMPLPPGWKDDEETENFVHEEKGLSTSNHPLDPYFVESIRRMRLSVLRRTQPQNLTSEEQTKAIAMLLGAKADGKSPLEVLGLHPSASKAEIRKRFRYLSLLVHPDKNPSSNAAEAFKILADAFKSA
ncbi:hypothetical protein HOP50_19g84130 [Chloropicon primus]|nr:hypothetical protein HOP50_19g84130 [Chloropicon primus]